MEIDANVIINKLTDRIGSLMLELTVKDAQIEMLNAKISSQSPEPSPEPSPGAPSETPKTERIASTDAPF